MKVFYCIGCGGEIGKKFARYHGEHVCLKCWWNLDSKAQYEFDRWNRSAWWMQKYHDRGDETKETDWAAIAVGCARGWAIVRDALQVTPFPAGLREFLKEMNW